jgi:hypothetical protein
VDLVELLLYTVIVCAELIYSLYAFFIVVIICTMDVAAILKLGADYGLDGKLLADFLRDERAAQRDLAKAEKEAEAKDEANKLELDRIRLANEERENQRKHEMEERDRQRAHELEVLRLNRELPQGVGADQPPTVKSIKPKIPPFEDSKEEIDAYLHRFERYAIAQKWDRTTWATSISALLKGEALSVYYRLPVEDYDNYDAIKTALLKRYQMTEQGFRDKFRKACPEHGETFTQFMTRLDMYFTRWIELSKIEKNYNKLKDLLLREQALEVASKDLRIFLQERKPKDVKEMGTLAEQYLEVHGKLYDMWHSQNKTSKAQQSTDKKDKDKTNKSDVKSDAKPNLHEEDRTKRTCFICHKPGHFFKDCRFRKKNNQDQVTAMQAIMSEPAVVTLENGWTVPVSVKDGVKYIKTKEGNIKCALSLEQQMGVPQVIGKLVGHGLVRVVRDTGCTGVIVREDLCPRDSFTGDSGSCTMIDGSVKVAPIVMVQLDTPFFKGRVRAIAMSSPIFDVIVGNIPGARNASDPDFLWKPEEDDSTVRGIANSPTGELKSAENENQLGQMSLSSEAEGFNDLCASGVQHSESHHCDGELFQLSNVPEGVVGYKCEVDDDVTSKEVQSDTVISAGVVTRSQHKVRGLKPLLVAQPNLVSVDRRQLIDLQKQDQSLVKVWTLVDNPVVQNRSWQECYFVEDEVLYREHTSSEKTGCRVTRQLVLPKTLREGVMEVAHDSILGGHLGTQKTVDRVLSNFY